MEIDGHFTKRRQEKHVMEVEIFKTLQFTIIGFVYFHPQYIFVTFDFNFCKKVLAQRTAQFRAIQRRLLTRYLLISRFYKIRKGSIIDSQVQGQDPNTAD